MFTKSSGFRAANPVAVEVEVVDAEDVLALATPLVDMIAISFVFALFLQTTMFNWLPSPA